MTVTVNVHVAVLPCASVAVLVTVVTPTGKLVPLAGLLDTVTPGQLSVAVTMKVTFLLDAPGAASTTMVSAALGSFINFGLIGGDACDDHWKLVQPAFRKLCTN